MEIKSLNVPSPHTDFSHSLVSTSWRSPFYCWLLSAGSVCLSLSLSHTHAYTQSYYCASVKLHRVCDLGIKADIICSLELSFQDVSQLLTSTNGLGLRSTANLKWQSSQ